MSFRETEGLTRVDLLMFGQMIVPYEGFSALVTLVAFVVMVNSEVEPMPEVDCRQLCLPPEKILPWNVCRLTCRSYCGENSVRRCCTGEASRRCESSDAL